MTITFYLSLIFFTIIATLNLRWAWWLLVALLPAYLLREQIWFIPTTWLELGIYLLFVVNIFKLWRQKILISEIKNLWTNYRFLWFGMIIWFLAALLATITSPDLRLSAGVLKGWWFDPMLLIITSLILLRRKKDLYFILLALLSSGAWVATWGLVEYVVNFGMQADGLLNSVFKPANYVAMLLVPTILLGWGVLKNSPTQKHKLLTSLSISLQLVALWYTKSYGGFLGLIAGVIILLFFITSRSVKKIALIIFLLVMLFGTVAVASQTKFQNIIQATERNSLTTRLQIWEISWELVKQRPILGVGLGNFYQPYRAQAFAMYSPPLEWEVVKAHNLFLNLWLEVGLVGLISFIFLLLIYFRQFIHLLQQSLPKWEWWYLAASFSALVATLTHGLLDTPYFKNDLSVLFYFILIIPFVLSYFKKNSID